MKDTKKVKRPWKLIAVLATAGTPLVAQAFGFDTGSPDVKVRWDNTLKYSSSWRLKNADCKVTSECSANVNPNEDVGDKNFRKGQISNRLDLFSEFDVSYKDVGFRLSGAAWYDAAYTGSPDSHSAVGGAPDYLPSVFGGSVGANQFPSATKKIHGQDSEWLDMFVFGKTGVGKDMELSGRAGRFSQLYGETLFMIANGIGYAQGPIDAVKLLSVPSTQAKELGRPVKQVSGNLQVSPALSLSAYIQSEWKPSRVPASGSYFNFVDFVGPGADLLFVDPAQQAAVFGPACGLPGPNGIPLCSGLVARGADQTPGNSGQWGAQVKFKLPGSETEYGLYAANYHEKTPIAVYRVLQNDYQLAYAKNIRTYGASVSTVIGETNVAGEISVRHNMPFAIPGHLSLLIDPTGTAKANDNANPAYAVGNSFHLNLSAITLLPASSLWEGATLLGELGFNRRNSVTKGRVYLDDTGTRDAWGMRVLFEPQYFQVLPGLDMTVPMSLGYAISGRSQVVSFGPEHGGDFSIGLNFDYQKTWKAGLNYTHFYGPAGAVAGTTSNAAALFAPPSYKQYYADRDFISFSVQRTF